MTVSSEAAANTLHRDVPPPLTGEHTWRFRFKSGRPSLNLVATRIGIGAQRSAGYERLLEPAYLDRWLYEAGLPLPAAAPGGAELAAALEGREAFAAAFVARLGHQPLDPASIGAINALASRESLAYRLGSDGRTRSLPTVAPVGHTLAFLAQDAIDILAMDGNPLKKCASPACDIMFVDTSRGGRRRWCAMSPCGDRANAAAYRSRRETGRPRVG